MTRDYKYRTVLTVLNGTYRLVTKTVKVKKQYHIEFFNLEAVQPLA